VNTRRFLLLSVCAVICAWSLQVIFRSLEQASPITRYAVSPGARVSAAARALRPNYPYSVIAGGAYSPAELRYANDRESLVRRHYADFDIHNARLVVLNTNRYQYVSYRLNDHIFWTRHRLLIPRGEVLLTDGRNYARTRCGNRLSNSAAPETTPLQPADSLLALPTFRPEMLAKTSLQLAPAPPPGELEQAYPQLPFESPRLAPYLPTGVEASLPMPESWPESDTPSPIAAISPAFPTPASPVFETPAPPVAKSVTPASPVLKAEVPEPGSLLLFGIVLCLSGWLLGRMARASRKADDRSTKDEK